MKTLRVISSLMLIGAAAACSVGCTARAGVAGYARTGPPIYYSEPPTLVYVGPEVWVVQDAAYPVYYSDGYYWSYYDDVWYRSDTYEGSWLRVDFNIVPTRIIHRDHTAYVHYRGSAGAQTRVAPRGPAMRPAALEHPHGGPPGQMKRYQPRDREQPVDRVPPGHQRRMEQTLPPGQQRHMQQAVPRAEERGRPPPQQQQRGRNQSERRREREHEHEHEHEHGRH